VTLLNRPRRRLARQDRASARCRLNRRHV
jgi:hypothetical protein